jgi:uncharacterized membrane protein YkvA (DUF1232 family)
MYRFAFPLLMMLVPRFLPQIFRYLVLIWKLIWDRRVNPILRSLVPLALLYFIVPFGLVHNRVPVLGRLDDIIILGLAVLFLIKLAPRHIVDEHLGKTPPSDRPEDHDPKNVVDGTSRPIDE